ncbi:beta and beta-prime subunits of DNA dependent RNA-polymerase [Wallemia mellicola]|nr:beta and beta-prime subunits of DNA dependent RNA-polymerase [Wallemia mellicola]TIB87956.1 beta and beta-prime subunits of DNA dependent RNA-polymerase [Wallemia mellicola]TIC41612.1 beta and beta-prime subunits of DNA dependent RNA-polymerase [Wallemia mellicola]TIC48690.1 beta and beta-prime subunits of DNA dependent RNA-polymerase [Wallemia mellicola]
MRGLISDSQMAKPKTNQKRQTQKAEKQQRYKKGDELNVFELVQDDDNKRRSNLTTKLDKDEDYDQRGGEDDSDDERMRNIKIDHLKEGIVNESDDEEIDSDDAFEESDEEKYADWTFTGSKQSNKKKNTKFDNVDEEDEDEEEGMVDLDTMLDDDQPIDEQITKDDVDDSDIEYEEDDDQGDSTKLTDLVNSLDPSARKSYKADASMDDDGFVAGQNSEFRVPADGPVSLDSLLAPLPTGIAATIDQQVKPLKPSESKTAKRGALSAPLATFFKERADREAGQKVVKDDVKQWDSTMRALENSNTLSFPLQGPGQGGLEDGSKAGGDLVGRFQPSNPLESSVDELLKSNNLTRKVAPSDSLPEQDESKLSKDQIRAKYQALRQQRQLMYESEKKAARMNKIKSKTYRRLKRKEREANKQKALEAGVIDSDEERMNVERQRALERATLRHKGGNSKWAREMKDRSEGDRDVLNELHRMEELGQRIRGEKADNEDDDDSDYSVGDNDDEDAVKLAALNKMRSLQQKDESTADEKFKGIAGMKFMRDASARENKAMEDEAEEFAKEMRGEGDDDSERMTVGGNPGRFVVGAGKKSKPTTEATNDDDDEEPGSATSSRTLGRELEDTRADNKAISFDTFKEQYERDNDDDNDDESNPWLTADNEGIKRAKKKNIATVSKVSKKVDKSQADFKKRKRANQGANEEEAIDLDLDATINKASKNAAKKQKRKSGQNAQDGFASESDSDEDIVGGGVQAFKQRDLVAEAFAADDVVQNFAEEKKQEIEAEGPQEIDTSLPGWGNWSGKGVKKNKAAEEKKRAKFLKKTAGVEADKRKDADKGHVIISEKTEKRSLDKYSLKDLPYPFTSRSQFEAAMSNPIGQEFNTTLGDDSASKPTAKANQKENVDMSSESAFPSLPAATPKQSLGAWAKPVIQRTLFQSTYTIPQSQVLAALSNQKSRQAPKSTSELFKKVSSTYNVNVDSSTTSQTKQTTFLVKGQSQKAVNEAIAYLTTILSARITITINIPNSSRALLIGPKGSTLKSITDSTKTRIQVPPKPAVDQEIKPSNQDDTDDDSDNDYSIPITIEGHEGSIKQAQQQVYDIISQVIRSYTKRITTIPTSFYPLIALKSSQLEQQLQITISIPSQARLRAIAHQAVGEESEISEQERTKQSAILLKGEKSSVKAAIQSIDRIFNDCQRTTKTISIPIPKRQHRTLVGAIGDEILEKTQCIVELPAADDISETCTIRGPQIKLPAALQLVMEKASALAVEVVDLLSIHRVKTDLSYGVNVLRYLLRGGKLNKIADNHPGAKIYPPRYAYIEKSQSVIIDIVSSDVSIAISAREQVEKLVLSIPPSAVKSVEIDHLLHRHLAGKQSRQFEENKKITLLFPHESEQRDDIGLIYTGSSDLGLEGKALTNKIDEIIQDGVNSLMNLAKAASNITIQIVNVDPKFHKSIVGPGGTTLNAIIGQDNLVDVQLGTSKSPNYSNKKEINEDEISVRGQKEEVERVVGELQRIANEAENHHIVYGHEAEISINNQYVPHIVGKNGSSISKLRESLGVQIDITQKQSNDNLKKSPQKATVKITGRKENVEEAKRRLNGLVEQLADQTTEKLNIARQYHASLIGTGGKYAIRLEEKHAVKILFPKSSSEDESSDSVTVKGGRKGVAAAKAELLEALEFEKENNNTLKISIPSSSIARIVGKGGQQINEIKENSGAQVDFDRSTEMQQKVTINLRGTKKAIQLAKTEILTIIEQINSQQIINIDDIETKYHKSIIGQGGSKLREIIEKAGGPVDTQTQSGIVQFPKLNINSDNTGIVIKTEKSLAQSIEKEIRSFVAELSDRKTFGVVIPTNLHGDMIGRGGSKLIATQKEFNVNIHFPGSRDYNNMDKPLNIEELNGADASTIVKVTGKSSDVNSAIEELKKRSTVLTKVVTVPSKYYHGISDNGRFFRNLRSYGVTIEVSNIPTKEDSKIPSPSNLTPPEAVSRVDVDGEDTIAHRWETYELNTSEDDNDSEWKIHGKDEGSLDKAVKAINNAVEKVKKAECVGYLLLQNRSTFPRIVGSKGSGIERIKNESGVQSLTVSKSDIPLITFIEKVADHAKYHQEPKGIWMKAKQWLAVNPEISSGLINHHQFRKIPPGSRPEKYVQPISKSSDIAENPYFKRDVRRAFPKTSHVSQNELAQLLISNPDFKALPNPAEAQTKALAQVKDSPETLDLAQVLDVLPAAQSPYTGLPPTPPFRPNPMRETNCARVLLTEEQRRSYLKRFRRPNLENLQRQTACKAVNTACRKNLYCPYCQSTNGVVKKTGLLKIVHEKFRAKKTQGEQQEFVNTFNTAINMSKEIAPHLNKAQDDLNPLRVLDLFTRISNEDCELLGMNPKEARPEQYVWQYMHVPPVCIRPSVAQDGATNEDDITVKLGEIVQTSQIIKMGMSSGKSTTSQLMEQWELLQLACAMYINAEMPGVPSDKATKPIRGFVQRLKGKQGRFRGNLSGKRVDFSGRTVIGPDPNLSVNEVAVPQRIAKVLTYPERVFEHNIESLRQAVRNGPDVHPGANYVQNGGVNGFKRFLKFGNREEIANRLRIGDIVERHLRDRDLILFNRQPSLHRLSIMCHYVKVRPWRTLRLNECACNPYNADFDGDEMNMHVPQTEEARTEAQELMGVKHNMVTPRNGEPIIAAIQDFITAAYLLSKKDYLLDRQEFSQVVSYLDHANMHIDLPPPAILKPKRMWTGKQILSILMRPNKSSPVLVNLEAKNRTNHPPPKGMLPDMSSNDGYLVIRNSQIMCGHFDKATVGDGKKNSVFGVILRDYGPDEAVNAMNRLARVCARWLASVGFSLGISDVMPSMDLRKRKEVLVEEAYAHCNDLIEKAKYGKLENQPGCDQEQTLESLISGILSKVRDVVGASCMEELSRYNAPLIMATCGSKGLLVIKFKKELTNGFLGSVINVSQMVACVGQQIISGKRVPNGFQDRSLPHFPKKAKDPPSKGFVRNSFFSGLSPPEFLFHAISGREGLVDTAVKTAETGYMQRRLMKALEDLSAHYDRSVRTSSGIVVQFLYGSDGLDPVSLEGDGQPVEFLRSWKHTKAILDSSKHERGMLPFEITEHVDKELRTKRWMKECTPHYLSTIRNFIFSSITKKLADLRDAHGMFDALTKSDEWDEETDLNMGAADFEKAIVDNKAKVTLPQLQEFLNICWQKYVKSKVEPGTTVGPIGAQSIGEPGTQMTLKTFHFAGVASMNVTLGVPRIKEIINAAKAISTPIISSKLYDDQSESAARIVKGRLEKTYLGDIASHIEESYRGDCNAVSVFVDMDAVQKLQLELKLSDIATAIAKDKKLKVKKEDIKENYTKNRIRISVKLGPDAFHITRHLRRNLEHVVVAGIPGITRAIININEKENKRKELLVEGYGLLDVMTTEGIIGTRTSSNHVMEVQNVLGIEAARSSIINEIDNVMSSHGMGIDNRHIQLLSDSMTFKGEVLGITRFGVAKMKDSVLMLASFEKTTDHLFNAAFHAKRDAIEGVSESIIMGNPAENCDTASTLTVSKFVLMEYAGKVIETVKHIRETRLSRLRPVNEFFDHHRLSRPSDMNEATSRITYNTRHFSGNYGVVVAVLSVYALLTNPFLLIAIGVIVGGFTAIQRFAADPLQVGEHVITQKGLYGVLVVLGLVLFWIAAPLSILFWLVGSSTILILGHAALIEPGVESEYAPVEEV